MVLACGDAAGHGAFQSLTERDDVTVREVGARPGRDEVDPVLADLGDRRLVIFGTDADLASVVLRLLRKDLLGTVTVGYIPTGESAVASLWDLPDGAIEVALRGDVDAVPLVRDDAGGVLVGVGRIAPVRGVAYCDDTTVVRGRVSAVEVSPDPAQGLLVRVIHRGLIGKRVREYKGRAFQLGSLPVHPVKDGESHPRPMTKWTWYRHTEDLRVARGVV
ncbi:hypothetical protein [Actinocrispum sp. NPDC049592]|uniref:hypothetical protein n=1 Tax=Actinocrispum sp. NPDC049592 TaxID=3154835 RepID=UPI00343828FD